MQDRFTACSFHDHFDASNNGYVLRVGTSRLSTTQLKGILALESQDYLVRACFVPFGPMASLHSYVPHVGCGAVIYGRRHGVLQPENGGGQWVLNSC